MSTLTIDHRPLTITFSFCIDHMPKSSRINGQVKINDQRSMIKELRV